MSTVYTSRPATVEGIQRSSAMGETGELDLSDVIETTDEVDTLEWFLMSSEENDVRRLE